jgi:hypothetical protein
MNELKNVEQKTKPNNKGSNSVFLSDNIEQYIVYEKDNLKIIGNLSDLPEEKLEEILNYITKHTSSKEKHLHDSSKVWDYFLSSTTISEDFLEKHLEEFGRNHWKLIIENCNLSIDFLKKYENKIDFSDFLRKNKHLNLFDESFSTPISYDMSKFILDKVKPVLARQYYGKYADAIRAIAIRGQLNEDLIRQNLDLFPIALIFASQKLSEDFINEIINGRNDATDMVELSFNKNTPLSEEFIKKHIDKFNIFGIAQNQELSEDFVLELLKTHKLLQTQYLKLFIEALFQGPSSLSDDFVQKMIDDKLIDKKEAWKCISRYKKLTVDFILKNMEKIDIKELKKNERINQKDMEKKKIYKILQDL